MALFLDGLISKYLQSTRYETSQMNIRKWRPITHATDCIDCILTCSIGSSRKSILLCSISSESADRLRVFENSPISHVPAKSSKSVPSSQYWSVTSWRFQGTYEQLCDVFDHKDQSNAMPTVKQTFIRINKSRDLQLINDLTGSRVQFHYWTESRS